MRQSGDRGGEVEPMPFWKRLWEGWLAIAARFGHVQTLMLLSLFYAVLVGPVALGIAIARRDLLDRRGLRQGKTAWREADSAAPSLERARLTT